MTTAEIVDSACKLRADEQLFLIDSLHDMLDEPDPALQAAWTTEAKDRLVAYDGAALPLAELAPVLNKYR